MIKVLIKAGSNSEWDSVSHFLLHLNQQFIKHIQEIQDKLKIFEPDIVSLKLFNPFDGKFVNIDEDKNPEYFLNNITITQNESYFLPAQVINSYHILIDKYAISFIGYGKHTGEEFYSYEVSIEELQNLLK